MLQKPPTINGVAVPYGEPLATLAEKIKNPGPEAWAAFVAIGFDESPGALDLLLSMTRADDASLRRAAVVAMRYHREGLRANARVLELAEGDEKSVSIAATETAAYFKLRSVRGSALELLKSPDADIRERAAAIFEKVWVDEDFDIFMIVLESDPSEPVRNVAARVLAAHGSAENWRRIFDIFKKSTNAQHRVWACELAGRFAPGEAREILGPFRADPNGHVRGAVRRAAGELDRW